jgi:hypothetical protein
MTNIEKFLGGPLTLIEALVGHLTFRAYERISPPANPPHAGKFGHAIYYTIFEIQAVLAEAEQHLLGQQVNDKNDRIMAFYYIINTSGRGEASTHSMPSVMLVGSIKVDLGNGKFAIKNVLEEVIAKLPENLVNNPRNITQPDIDAIINQISFTKYPLNFYDMGDRHP